MKKYLVLPDFVRSNTDNQLHFVGSRRLVNLYRVRPEECLFIRGRSDFLGRDVEQLLDLYFLRPLDSGKYPSFGYPLVPQVDREFKRFVLDNHRWKVSEGGYLCERVPY